MFSLYRDLVEDFLPNVVGVSRKQIDQMTHGNIIRVFGDKLGGVA